MRTDEQIVPATEDDFVAVYGDKSKLSFFGFAVRKDGKTHAVAGVYVSQMMPVVFSQIAAPVSKRTILKVAYKVLALVKRKGLPLFALRDEKVATSDSFIRHFGFVSIGRTEQGEIFKWPS